MQWFKSWLRWRATGTVWGTDPQRGKVLLEQWRCLWKGQNPPASTELLAQSLSEYKCNAEKEKSACFTASHIFLLVLHPPAVTVASGKVRPLHTQLQFIITALQQDGVMKVCKDGKISDESHKSDTVMASPSTNTTASSSLAVLSPTSIQMSRALAQGIKSQKSQLLWGMHNVWCSVSGTQLPEGPEQPPQGNEPSNWISLQSLTLTVSALLSSWHKSTRAKQQPEDTQPLF